MLIPEWPIATDRELEFLKEVLCSRQWGGFHEVVERFERTFAEFQHCKHGVTAVNGTVTLEMALQAAGVQEGDEVIVPAISFISTATAVSRVGGIPVFVDIGPLSFQMDPDCAARAITSKTRAIIPVHFGGPLADMDQLPQLAAGHGLALIEDAAHAHGSEWRGRRAGSFGLAGSFSFQNSKVMTAGEGGILLSNDAGFDEQVRSFANQGRRQDQGWFHHYTLGTNYRITAFQAAVLLAQLERLPEQISLRTRNAQFLRSDLADVKGLQFQEIAPEVSSNSWYLFLGRVDQKTLGVSRDDFCRSLTEAGVPCTPFYPHPLYGNPLYRAGGCRVEPCPNAEARIEDAFWLPHRALMSNAEVTGQIAEAIRKSCQKN
ncbi:MAG: DegT/DnrJ/EryC1/StrS family aminotransferase [Bryobacteraceae bacterium]|nr:DegT/DnrJ/EryC1/StrS family aminotransferase [Bryobacteraceae bacterium]